MYPVIRRERSFWNDPSTLIRREFDRMFRGFGLGDGDVDLAEPLTANYPVDMSEDDESIHIDAEMPGFNKDEIEVSLEEGLLTISGERKAEEQKKGTTHLHERRYHKVFRQLTLPTAVDEDDIDAEFRDGVLHLRLKKSAESRRRTIQIK